MSCFVKTTRGSAEVSDWLDGEEVCDAVGVGRIDLGGILWRKGLREGWFDVTVYFIGLVLTHYIIKSSDNRQNNSIEQ